MKNILFLFSLILFFSCKKFEAKRISKVVSKEVEFVNNNVNAIGSIIDISSEGIQDHGFCWSKNANPTIQDATSSLNSSETIGDFNCGFQNLLFGETYYARAFAKSGGQVIYGEVLSFNTNQAKISVKNATPKIINSGKITVEGIIDSIGVIFITQYGHCYSELPNPTILNNKTINYELKNDTVFKSEILGLALNTTYYIKAYAKLSDQNIVYSNMQTILIPVIKVSTDTFTTINSTTSNLKGSLLDLGADPITEYGFVWSITNPTPNYNDNKIINPANPKVGAYFNDLTGLNSGNKYYFRAYATNGNNVYYGTIKSIQK